ncbi:hypothetical protein [Endozoicomonas euniceicola]|uniref:Uncharacterized protein n=1 Tax=Endozoicomonas euniceicola TaxID=1234143 RepID=A0ABY6GTI5_9GAMM|nr:hypothetical protein [Endozoicomonas euniceicola]UYM15361.1 hypothetical protein NX720_21290 [Endozoicomonas euniceicola]
MKELLLLALVLLLPCAHAADFVDETYDESRILLDECLNDRFGIPSGPYISQRCGDDADCIRENFDYDPELDELSYHPNTSYFRVIKSFVGNICKLKKQGFELNLSTKFHLLGASYPDAYIRFIGVNGKEVRILSGDGAIAENERTPIERWIMKKENHFQQTCRNIRYYPSQDMLTANCYSASYHIAWDGVRKVPKVISNTAIPYISLYNDNNNLLVNNDGMLRATLIDNNPLFTTRKHARIKGLCNARNAEHKHIDGYEVCDSKKKIPVHNCDVEESVYDGVFDTFFVRCRGHKRVYHLQNAKICLDQDYEIHFIQQIKANPLGMGVYVAWEGLFCRVNKPKFRERYGL